MWAPGDRHRELQLVRWEQDRIIAEMDEILDQLARLKESQGKVEVDQIDWPLRVYNKVGVGAPYWP
jgi:hypothetical protein